MLSGDSLGLVVWLCQGKKLIHATVAHQNMLTSTIVLEPSLHGNHKKDTTVSTYKRC